MWTRATLSLLTVVAIGLTAATTRDGAPSRSPSTPRPVTVALVGDSIVEGPGVTQPNGLAAMLRAHLARDGFRSGADGFVPAHGADLEELDDGTIAAPPWSYSGRWRFLGVSPFFESPTIAFSADPLFGADGHASQTDQRGANATATVRGDRFAVLFARTPDGGALRFAVDGAARTIDTRGDRADGGGIAWLTARSGASGTHRVTVAAGGGGDVTFTGLLASPGRAAVEVLALGRACGCAYEAFGRLQREATAVLQADITVLLFGTNEQAREAAGSSGARHGRRAATTRTRSAASGRRPGPSPRG